MSVDPPGAGTTEPIGIITIKKGTLHTITAIPSLGYQFEKWTVSDNGKLSDELSSHTTVLPEGDCTVTAHFKKDDQVDLNAQYIASGSVITINSSELKDLEEFGSKLKVYAQYQDLYKGNQGKKPLKIITHENSVSSINALFKKKIVLCRKKDYKGKLLSEELSNHPVKDFELDGIFVKAKGQNPVKVDQKFYFAAPVVTDVIIKGDFPLKKKDIMIIKGNYFGSHAPQVFVEYINKNGKAKYKRCKIEKRATYQYTNGLNKSNKSCMKIWPDDKGDEEVGYSEVTAYYPSLKEGKDEPTGFIAINNGAGIAVFELPEK